MRLLATRLVYEKRCGGITPPIPQDVISDMTKAQETIETTPGVMFKDDPSIGARIMAAISQDED